MLTSFAFLVLNPNEEEEAAEKTRRQQQQHEEEDGIEKQKVLLSGDSVFNFYSGRFEHY
ncbi:uncharacterized protein V6R79_008129 [Siganus canaliculatus]